MFDRVLVANRGEIAVRVMRACKELGIETIAIYSDADKHAGHVRYADEAYNVGPASAADSYLDQDSIIEVAERSDADAIHPGYGFLAENAEFARQVEASRAVWIGPSSAAMERLGEKTEARKLMQSAGVPIVPGTTEPVDSAEQVRELGDEYGYPIAIKAEGGGGGRGLKVIHEESAIDEELESAQREGEAYFGNAAVYVEKYLESPRHVEVQILADEHGNVRHLGERDCSLQRRHQKIIEEAPSPVLDDEVRNQMGDGARAGVREAGYSNAGTVEFLVTDDEYYFMEVNTRIQVEHTVTEAITGLDIVKWQLRIAAGEELNFEQDDVTFDGHAIEYRINAENPANEFAPTPGSLTTYEPPGGIGVRVDGAVREGDEISGNYDSMIAKLIVKASDRVECLARSERALREYNIEGVHTTIPFHRLMLIDAAFIENRHTTKYLDKELAQDSVRKAVDRWGPGELEQGEADDVIERTFTVEVNGKRFAVDVEERGPPRHHGTQSSGGQQQSIQESSTIDSAATGGSHDSDSESVPVEGEGEIVTAEMQGTILEVAVAAGDTVDPGEVLCVLEAMKMENDIVSSRAGTVTDVRVREGETVNMGDVLVVIE